MIANLCTTVIERKWEIVILHLSRQGLAQRGVKALRTIDVPLGPTCEKRLKEWDALDMVPMRVADQDVAAQAICTARNKVLA